MIKITSPDFNNNEGLDQKFTCDGENMRPALVFSDVPSEAKSLVVVVDDPDAPDGVYTHWIIANIPPDISVLSGDSLPESASEGLNSNHKVGWIAPCPPYQVHNYHFIVYALNTLSIKFTKYDNKQELYNLIDGHVIESAEMIGTYKRK